MPCPAHGSYHTDDNEEEEEKEESYLEVETRHLISPMMETLKEQNLYLTLQPINTQNCITLLMEKGFQVSQASRGGRRASNLRKNKNVVLSLYIEEKEDPHRLVSLCGSIVLHLNSRVKQQISAVLVNMARDLIHNCCSCRRCHQAGYIRRDIY